MDEPRGDEPRVLLTGIGLGESPRWHEGRLWFSDWLAHEIVAVDLDGNREVVLEVRGIPFNFDWAPDGAMLLVCNDGGRRLLRRGPDGSLTAHADLTHLVDRPWNEIVVDGRGNAYVNSIGFDMLAGEEPAPGIALRSRPNALHRRPGRTSRNERNIEPRVGRRNHASGGSWISAASRVRERLLP